MPVFRALSEGNARSFFYDVLVDHLKGLASAAKIFLLRLDSPHGTGAYVEIEMRSDHLLVYEGKALAAVEINVHPSTYMESGYVSHRAYAGVDARKEGNLDSMAERLQAQLVAELPVKEETAPPLPELQEAKWHISLRLPGQKISTKWHGGPFDLDEVERAFESIVKAIIERAKA